MGNNKSIAFYTCSNGLGHFKRVTEVAKLLKDDFDITIYCSKFQPHIIGKLNNVKYIFYTQDNIRWDLVLKGDHDLAIDQYLNWSDQYLETTSKYDIVISDNLVSICKERKDAILMGSFFWSDVFKDYLGHNFLSSLDDALLKTRQPLVLTNKYLETQSMKEYTNKKQYGFGGADGIKIVSDLKYIIGLEPSLSYSPKYKTKINEVIDKSKFGVKDKLSYIHNTCIVARPGVGTITHCVEHLIPLIALYSDNDSSEIKELAQYVEDLSIGFKQNVDEPVRIDKLKALRSNQGMIPTFSLEKNGYEQIANYIKSI